MAYKITTNAGFVDAYFETEELHEAMDLVSMIAEYGRNRHGIYNEDNERIGYEYKPLGATLKKVGTTYVVTFSKYADAEFRLINYDDAMAMVSLLVDLGKIERTTKDADTELVKSTIEPVSVTLVRFDEEVGLNE